MRIISFAWTTPALVAGRKTVTRREWDPCYAQKFRAGDLVQAYDRSPRYGGKQIGVIRLTRDPYLEATSQMSDEDYEAEGMKWFEETGRMLYQLKMDPQDFWQRWKASDEDLWVIRFEIVEIFEQETEQTDQMEMFR